MRECLGKHSCMNYPFPIAILNGTFFFYETTWSKWWKSCISKSNYNNNNNNLCRFFTALMKFLFFVLNYIGNIIDLLFWNAIEKYIKVNKYLQLFSRKFCDLQSFEAWRDVRCDYYSYWDLIHLSNSLIDVASSCLLSWLNSFSIQYSSIKLHRYVQSPIWVLYTLQCSSIKLHRCTYTHPFECSTLYST